MLETSGQIQIENQGKKPSNKAKILGLCLLVLLILLAGGFFIYKNKHQVKNGSLLLKNKDRHLSAAAEKIYYDRIKKAEDDLKGSNPKKPDYHIRQVNDHTYLGEQYFGLGQLEKSKQEYLQVLKIDEKNEAALVGLSYVYMDAGEIGSASNLLEIAIKNNPKNYNLWLEKIQIEKSAGADSQGLEKIYEEALKATNNYPDVLTSYAQFEESLGHLDKAISLWQLAVTKSPESADLYSKEVARLKLIKK